MNDLAFLPKELPKDAPILITGAKGFIGRNLSVRLSALGHTNLLLFDVDSPQNSLEDFARKAAFVFHLAGVNRPQQPEEFFSGNAGLTTLLLGFLTASGKRAPLVFSSTAQVGNNSDYAKSKKTAEDAVFAYGKGLDIPVFVYRLPGVFGKWSRPNYNTVVATFCHNIARGLPLDVRDPAFSLALCYVDDVVDSFMAHLSPKNPQFAEILRKDGNFYALEPTYEVTLGWLSGTVRSFAHTRKSLSLPDLSDSLTRKLWATYLSFIPQDECIYPLNTHTDERGGFTEFIRTHEHGQVSVNVAKPGITKGKHWHDTKNEKFLVVSGKAIIKLRTMGTQNVQEYAVDAEKLQVVDIPPGTAHSIENVGSADLVTIIWASEPFNPEKPDTYFEEV